MSAETLLRTYRERGPFGSRLLPCKILLDLHGSGAGPTPRTSSEAQTSPRVVMSVKVTAEDETKFIQQDLEEYISLCDKSFQEHKFDCAEAGLKIGHVIISEFLKEDRNHSAKSASKCS